MRALGRQLLVDLKDCKAKNLDNMEEIQNIMTTAAKLAGATIKEAIFHKFSPHGVSGMVIIAESHLSVHTWPEYDYAAVDIFTCGEDLKPEKAIGYLIDKFQSNDPAITEFKRGVLRTEDKNLSRKFEPG
ncbi:S-adenosylmethionine decarboxylase proenzyme precursor [bacterium BMS3Abin15]|nr:S-adenosylmethionine decarboxylase proenzyme precursor [bacterium BMS3Abin15]HDH07742.1 adenosylmethionine decarboxylase [Candidatus Moranbacteria bacterium]HDZ85244.1 adenosylmethionine decarboxylase [Candidatus Moranbacteria bacterium]